MGINAEKQDTGLSMLARRTFSSLSSRNFRWYCLGVFASLTGSLMQEIVVAWIAYQMTGSSFVLGTILFSFQVPMIVVGLAGGWAADRFDRKRIIVATQFLAFGVSLTWLILSATGLLEVWHLYALSAVFGTIVAFEIPARFAIIPQLVEEKDIMNAFSLDSLLFYSGRVGGPAIAAMMLAFLGATGCFAINALTYLFELITLRKIIPEERDKEDSPGIGEAFRFAYGTPAIRNTLFFVAVMSFCGIYVPLMPVFTAQLGGTGSLNGLLIAISEAGAMIGSLLLAYITARKDSVRAVNRMVGVAGVSYAIFFALFAQTFSLTWSLILIVPVGFSMTIVLIGSHAFIQNFVDDRMRGSISTMFWMYSYFGMFALGGPTFGWLIETIGPEKTITLAGSACAIASTVYIMTRRRWALEQPA